MIGSSVFTTAVALVAGLASFKLASGAPAPLVEVEERGVEKRQTPSAPHFVLYADDWATPPPDQSTLSGWNVWIMGFYLESGPTDNVLGWQDLDASTRASTKSEYEAAGIKLMISCFGSTNTPTTDGVDPTSFANQVSAWVLEYGLDGVDVDYEDFAAVNSGTAEAWLITFTQVLRQQLPVGEYILTHAPIAPWFDPTYPSGGYLAVDTAVGDLIDWYNVQFYSQGTLYADCTSLISDDPTYQSSLEQIIANGAPSDKVVLGKPATSGEASGYVDPATLAGCVSTAKATGWNAGLMVWQNPYYEPAGWVSEVWG